mgnify:CR=1 FL=1
MNYVATLAILALIGLTLGGCTDAMPMKVGEIYNVDRADEAEPYTSDDPAVATVKPLGGRTYVYANKPGRTIIYSRSHSIKVEVSR